MATDRVTFFPGRPRRVLVVLVALLMAVGLVGVGAATSGSSGARASGPDRPPLSERVRVGAYVAGMQSNPAALDRWEERTGTRAAVASYYYGYGDVFPGPTELRFADGGTRDVLLSWDMGPTRFEDWSQGRHDAYLDQVAAAAAEYPYDVYVRPWPEMNGDWQSFQPTADGARPHGGTYAEFRAAWRHVVTYLREHGADNLRWVFNPTADTYAETTPVGRIWPGRRYVDVLGLDGFNWGEDAGWGQWLPFRQVFARQYRRLTALDPRLPVWICEVGSKEPLEDDGAPADPDRSKASWVRSMFATRGFARLTTVVWFDEDKERNWRVDSSPRSRRAWSAAVGGQG